MPVAAVVSIAHRISGVLLFLAIPLLILALQESLRGPEGFERIASLFDNLIAKGAIILLGWSLAHHLLAGIRFLLIDVDIGVERETAGKSAWLVNVAGVIIALIIAGAVI